MSTAPVRRTQGAASRRSGELLLGGSPWGLARLTDAAARPWAHSVLRAGTAPRIPRTELERATARLLVDRGLALPVPAPRPPRPGEVDVVIPVHGSAAPLARLLSQLGTAGPRPLRVTVVDDATPGAAAREIARVCRDHGVHLVVLPENRGPGGARNAGLAAATADLVALLDADTLPPPDWLDALVPHLDDPGVAVVAPRVRGTVTGGGPGTVLERFEIGRGGLDLGVHARRVAPGGQLGYVPTAALLVRRDALPEPAFEDGLRVGEDVDLIWRLVAQGWTVRYVPEVEVRHEVRTGLLAWVRRHAAYGSSAVPLEQRHPGSLAPATLGWPGLLALGGVLAVSAAGQGAAGRRFRAAGALAVLGGALVQVATQVRSFRGRGLPASVGAELALLGLRSEVTAIANALRREWWPVGAAAVVLGTAPVPGVRAVARAVVVLGLLPTVPDTARAARSWWRTGRGAGPLGPDAGPRLDPVRHLALRLLADAAYGTGVIGAAVRSRCPAVLLPRYRRRARG